MAYERRSFAGGAVATTITAGIDGSDTSITIASATGWPTGSAGDFFVVIDRGTATEEKVRIASRTSTTLSVDVSGRGVDGTSGVAHSSGASIEVCLTATDLDEANAHIADTTLDHHTQYLDTTRHDVEARHTFGAALGTPATPASIGTANATGSGNNPAREDHVHEIGTGAIDTAGQFAAGVIDAAAIGDDAVTTAKILDATVTTAKIADSNVTTAKIADDNVTTAKIADDAVTADQIAANAVVTAGILDANVTQAKLETNMQAAVDAYTPSNTNVTVGNGTLTARYARYGDVCWFEWSLTFGSTTSFGGNVAAGLPLARVGAGRTAVDVHIENSGIRIYAGAGRIIGTGTNVAVAHSESTNSGNVDATSPFTWDTGDVLTVSGVYPVA